MNAPVVVRQPARVRQAGDGLLLAPSLERRRPQCYLAQIVVDLSLLLLGFTAVGYVYLGLRAVGEALMNGQVLLPIFLTIALYNGTYSIHALRESNMAFTRPCWR